MAKAYSTFHPYDKHSGIVLSNGDLTMTAPTSASVLARGLLGRISGKFYFEVIVDTFVSDACIGIGLNNVGIGSYLGYDANGIGYRFNGKVYQNATIKQTYNSYTTNDIIGVALDLDNGEIYFSKNGTWQGSSNPATRTNPAVTGLSGCYYAACSTYKSTLTANFGASTLSYTVPDGFESGLFVEGVIATCGVGGDDGYVYSTTIKTAYNYTITGNSAGISNHAFFRFPNIDIGQGTTVEKAYLEYLVAGIIGSPLLKVHMNNVDNAVAPTNATEFNALSLDSGIDYDPSVTSNIRYTVDITNQVQAIINRSGWSSGNAMQAVMKDDSSVAYERLTIASFECSNSAPRLVIEISSAPTECLAEPGIIEITGSAATQYNKTSLAEPGIINISGSASGEKTLNAKTIKLKMVKTGQGLPFNLNLKSDYTDCNDPGYYFRYAFNPDCLFVGESVTVSVQGGVAPFDWVISGTYFTLGAAQTETRTNTVTCPDGTDPYQDETIYVTDACGNTVEGTVRYCPHNWNPITPLVMYDKWVAQTLTGPFAECMGVQVIGNTAYFLLFMIVEPFGHQLYKWSPGDESLTAVTNPIARASSYLGPYLEQANGTLYALTAYGYPLIKYTPGVDSDWVVIQEECDISEIISINNQLYGKDGSGFYSIDILGNETFIASFTGSGNLEYNPVTNTLINCNRVYSSYIQQYDFSSLELKNSCIWPHSAVINSVICNNAMYFTHSSSSGNVYKITIGTDTYENLIVDSSFSLLYSRFTKFKDRIFCVAWETGILKIMDEDNKQWVNVATPELEGSTIFAGEHTFSIGNSLYGLVFAKSADVGLVIFKWA